MLAMAVELPNTPFGVAGVSNGDDDAYGFQTPRNRK